MTKYIGLVGTIGKLPWDNDISQPWRRGEEVRKSIWIGVIHRVEFWGTLYRDIWALD
jgi:hypothetical protein